MQEALLQDAILKNDKDDVAKILGDREDVVNGHLMSVAIENGDVNMLALLLGVHYPTGERAHAISSSQHSRANSICDSEDVTPLMKAVQVGSVEMVSLLLHCGAEVNSFTQGGKAAVDFSDDPRILCELFYHDSMFPIGKNKGKEVQRLISEDEGGLSALFKARDEVHELMKAVGDHEEAGLLDSEIKVAIMRGKYFVNGEGHSLLHTALKNRKFGAWVELLDLGMDYVTLEEKEEETNHEDMCERALAGVLVPLEDSHVMKLVTKSFNRRSQRKDELNQRVVLEYFEYMNDNEITKTLMQVVQDVPGLHIAFDFDCASVERLRSCCLKNVRGITDIDLCKVCVAAKENDRIGFPEIVSNIVHEICHLALAVVYKNSGLPYAKHDTARQEQYKVIVDKVRISAGCDEIICKVWNYDSGLHGVELIVRVPEMISNYQRSVPDGTSRLKLQAEALLEFYKEKVQPDLEKYISRFATSNMIKSRGLLDYLEILSRVERVRVDVGIDKEITDFIGKHNHLKVLRASNVELARDHLKSCWEKKGKVAPFFVNWSLYKQWPGFFGKGLKSRAIETLAVVWDIDETPTFCKRTDCYGDCVGFYFREYVECVYFLVDVKWEVLKGIGSVEYSWDDLSPETKTMILEREVQLGGVCVDFKTLISSPEGGDVEDSMRNLLDSTDIDSLLGVEDIKLGAANCRGVYAIVLKHPRVFISRTLSRNVVEFNEGLLRKHADDVFLVSNVQVSHLYDLGISEDNVRQWDVSNCDVSVKCYVLCPSSDAGKEKSVFQEILDHLRSVRRGQVKKLHHLRFQRGFFAHIQSTNIQNDTGDRVEGLRSYAVKRQLETSDFEDTDPLLIANDAGTGKTSYLHSIAKDIKESHPEKWVSIIDLGSKTQQKHFEKIQDGKSSSQKETLGRLYRMVGSGMRKRSSLERKVFDEYCKKMNKIIIILDGFDEVCPKYKSVVTSFVVDLRKFNNNIKLLIATRLHEKLDLEAVLDAVTYQLVPFCENDQVKFLDEYWNELLMRLSLSAWRKKIESSIGSLKSWVKDEIDSDDVAKFISGMEEMLSNSCENKKVDRKRIDFKPVVRRVLSDRKALCSGLDSFMEIPLHAQMFAALVFEDSFNVKGTMSLGHLYQRFFDLKMKMYGREKVGDSGNVQSEEMIRMVQERIAETLEKLSVKLLLEELTCKVKNDEIRRACNVGLVSQDGEDDLQFIHRTFAEFFFARRMLKEADGSDVTKLWLGRIFADEHFARVRMFLEDILQLMSEGTTESTSAEDFLMLEKANLNQSVVDDDPSRLTFSIYCLILHSSVHTLQYFSDSFGEKVANMLIQDVDWKTRPANCSTAIEEAIFACKGGFWFCKWKGENIVYEDQNAFKFAAYFMLDDTVRHPGKHAAFLKKMLNLLKTHEMLNEIKHLLLTEGLELLLLTVSDNFMGTDVHYMYTLEILNFLLENKEIFGDNLRGWMTSTPDRSDYITGGEILRSVLTTYFDLLPRVIRALYDETQRERFLTEESFISNVWIDTLKTHGVVRTRQVWDFIKESLRQDVTHLRNYLLWRDEDGFNALVHTAFDDERPEMIEFVWELAGGLMDDHDKKKWLFDSFGSSVLTPPTYLGWSFHKLLARLVNGGFLSGDEMFLLLTSQEGENSCCILRDYPIGFFTHVLPIIDLCIPMESLENKMCNVNIFHHLVDWLEYKSWIPLNRDLKDEVDNIFEGVTSRDVYGFADKLVVSVENGLSFVDSYILEERFKFFVAVLSKQVDFCGIHFRQGGGHHVFRCLRTLPIEEQNILHLVSFRMTASCLGYVFSVLVDCLPQNDFLGLLLEENSSGETVFHLAVGYGRVDVWDKLNDVAVALLGEVPVSEMHKEQLDALKEICDSQRVVRLETNNPRRMSREGFDEEVELDW